MALVYHVGALRSVPNLLDRRPATLPDATHWAGMEKQPSPATVQTRVPDDAKPADRKEGRPDDSLARDDLPEAERIETQNDLA